LAVETNFEFSSRMAIITRIAVAGGTGRLGKHIVAALLKANFNVTILTRFGSSGEIPSGVIKAEVDYTSEPSLTAALQDHDALVGCLTSNEIGLQTTLFAAAAAAGVKRIIPSEYGILQIQPKSKDLPVIQPVVELQKALFKICESTGGRLSWTIIGTGVFLDIAVNSPLVLNWDQHSVSLYDGGNQQLSSSRLSTIAKAITGTLSSPERFKNRIVRIHDVIVTQNKWLEYAKKADPSATWTVNEVDTKPIVDQGLAALQNPANQGKEVMNDTAMKVMVVLTFGREYEMCWKDDELDNKDLGIELMDAKELEKIVGDRANGKMYEEGDTTGRFF
jgi:NmrA-like family